MIQILNTFYKTPRATQWRADGHGMLTNDWHILSSCELQTNSLNLFKGVTANISVVESDCRSVW